MSTRTISTPELSQLLSNEEAVLLDVRLEEQFAESHLPRSLNNCVLEVAFEERLQDQAPNKAVPIVVYGVNEESFESRHAAEKLERLGYPVRDYREGIEGWIDAGQDIVTGSSEDTDAPVLHGTMEIDLAESRLEWTGRNLLNKHWGTVALKSGELSFEQGRLLSGKVTIDLTKILCDDLEGGIHDVLIAHLQNHDFFDVSRHPEAHLTIKSASPIEGATASSPNLRLDCQLELRGEKNPLQIDATTGLTPDGIPAAQATIALDRTVWGSIYGSARFFQRLGMHLVNDLIDLQVRIVAKP